MSEASLAGATPTWANRMRERLDYPLYLIRRNPLTLFGFVVVILFVLIGLFAPVLAPKDPLALSPIDGLEPPSARFLFGTDQYGRDILSRIIYATQLDLLIALSSVGLAVLIGTSLGAFAGYYGGWADTVLMRLVDVIMAFPPFILAMGTAAALGAGVANIIYVVALIQTPIYVRLIRGEVLSARERPYAEAAKCMGNSGPVIIFAHLLPNCLPPLLVQVALNLSWAILDAAGLSFIGLGVRPPTPEWGGMINEGMEFMMAGKWWMAFFPGAAIFITILAFNLLADGLRDVFDPPVAMVGMEQLLEIRKLQTHFFLRRAVVKAVNGVSFSMAPGEMVGLVGESGSGKSVTALSVLRLIRAPGRVVSGEILFQGRDLLRLSEQDMMAVRGQAISMVFQNPRSCLNPVMKVGAQIARVHRTHKHSSGAAAMSRALEYLKLVQIADPERVMDRYPHQLSGGMCQRAMIAMALICEPALVIADEPTTGLDVTVQGQILELMRNLRRQTKAAQLLITHDLGVVAETCDRMIVMYAGRVVEMGDVISVFARPLHPYTAALLASVPDIKRDFRTTTIPGSVPDPRAFPPGCPFHPRCGKCMDVCRTVEPSLVELDNGRRVSCHLWPPDGGSDGAT